MIESCESLAAGLMIGGRRWKIWDGRSAASATSGWKRGGLFLRRMVEKNTVRLHGLARGRAEEVGYGRWLRNEAVTVSELQEYCGRALAGRVAGLHILAPQDTTELNYQRHAGRTSGLGPVGNGKDRGLFLHPMLAIDAASQRCLGLVGAAVWTRPEGPLEPRRQRPIEEKESHRWIRGLANAASVLGGARLVTVIDDREGDIYQSWAAPRAAHVHLLARAGQDRAIAEGGCLFAYSDGLAPVACYRIELPRQAGKREARSAAVELRYATITLKRPARLPSEAAPARVSLSLVDVREIAPPQGEKPVHWRLLTSHDIDTAEAALQLVDWYRQRWQIEQLFWTLKRQGFDLESSQLETAEALMKLAIMATQAATRVMQLMRARDGNDPTPAQEVFSPDEVEVIAALQPELEGKTERQKNPHRKGSLPWAAWTIARLGGWKGYSTAEGPAGPLTLKRGLDSFQQIFRGYALKRSVHR